MCSYIQKMTSSHIKTIKTSIHDTKRTQNTKVHFQKSVFQIACFQEIDILSNLCFPLNCMDRLWRAYFFSLSLSLFLYIYIYTWKQLFLKVLQVACANGKGINKPSKMISKSIPKSMNNRYRNKTMLELSKCGTIFICRCAVSWADRCFP